MIVRAYRWIPIEGHALVDELWPHVLGLDAPDVLPLLHYGRRGRDGTQADGAQYPRGGGNHPATFATLS